MKRNKYSIRKCRFHKICPYFYPESFTCINGGGSYCGKFRDFSQIYDIKKGKVPLEVEVMISK